MGSTDPPGFFPKHNSPKSSKAKSASGAKGKKSKSESKTEDALQAVVLADSFQDRYRPFSVEKPRCLLPLGNRPLIDHTFEFLALNGVSEVFIYCGAHTERVEEYVSRSRWATTSRSSPFSVVQFVRVAGARSVGDVLRDMDKRSLVDGDFLIVHGDLVSNLRLDGALARHRKRREESAANIMTMVLRSAEGEGCRTQSKGITPLFVVDNKTQRVLHYDEMHPLQSDHYLSLDPAIPDELATDFDLRADLIDPQIDICTAEVLALWTGGFDYELPRRNFLHGVLKDWELNGKMIYTEILEDGYCARANNLQMYDSVSRDVIDGWTAPFVPHNNTSSHGSYTLYDGALSMEDGAFSAPDAVVTRSIVARGTTIGKGCRINNCIIRKDCQIGDNVMLEDCYLWNDVTVGANSVIKQSILADASMVGKNCSVTEGCLFSFGVQISDDITLSKGTVLSTINASSEPVAKDTQLLGPNANAARFVDVSYETDDEDYDDEDPSRLQKSLLYNIADLNLSQSSISTLSSEIDDDSDSDAGGFAADAASSRSRLSSFTSDDSNRGGAFHSDAVHGILDALRGGSGDFDAAKLEFMGLRLANDASDVMMRKAVATAFARRAAELLTPEYGSLEPSKAAERALKTRKGATKFIEEVGIGGDEAEQVEYILFTQRTLVHVKDPRAGTILAALLQQLYAEDVLEEEVILGWWADDRAEESEGLKGLKEKCRVLVEWLENADEEESSEEEED